MKFRYPLALPTFLLASLLQPGAFAGCSSDDEQANYDFDKPELLSLVDDANAVSSWRFDHAGTQYSMAITLEDASSDEPPDQKAREASARSLFIARAYACGTRSRTFSAVASACSTRYLTELPVTGEAKVYRHDGDDAQLIAEHTLSGKLEVSGERLDYAEVRIELAGGPLKMTLTRDRTSYEFEHANIFDSSLGIVRPVGGEPAL